MADFVSIQSHPFSPCWLTNKLILTIGHFYKNRGFGGLTKKTVLKNVDVDKIVSTFHEAKVVDEFSVLPSADDIKSKNYSFSAGQYFEVKIKHVDITEDEFNQKIKEYKETLDSLFTEGKELESNIKSALGSLKYE